MIHRILVLIALISLSACPPPPPGDAGKCGSEPACTGGALCENDLCVHPCATDEECTGRRCNPESHRCEGCLNDDDCEVPGHICLEIGVCSPVEGCTLDTECGGGRCNVAKHACVACLTDAQCVAGKVCNQDTGACAPAAGICTSEAECNGRHCLIERSVCVDCLSDAQCPSGVTCDLESHVCLLPCTDTDTTEPNDTEATAVVLTPGSSRAGQLCPLDVDLVKLVLPAAGHLTATFSVEGSAATRLQLLRTGGMLVQEGVASVMGLTVNQTSLEAGTYFLKLFADGGVASPYSLRTTYLPSGTVCNQESTEPNDTPLTAATITADGAARGGALCPGDRDHFAATVVDGDRLRVLAAGQGGTVLVELLDPLGVVLQSGAPLQTESLTAGRYVVRLSTSVATPVNYTLSVSATAGPPPCRQADAEPNNESAQAITIAGDGSAREGAICMADVDRFKIVVQDRDRITAELAIVPGSGTGPLSIQLFNDVGGEVANGTSGVDAPQLVAGTYELVIQGNTLNSQAAYTLTTTITPDEPPLDPCADNGLEPNDTTGMAKPLTMGAPLTARICVMDQDFYSLEITSSDVVQILMTFSDDNGDLDLQVLDSLGAVVDSSEGVTDEEVVERGYAPGTYYIRVFGFSGASNPYTLRASVASCVGDDAYEENDRATAATPVAPGSLMAVRCPGDDDFFALVLLAGDSLTASVTGGLSADLLDGAGMVLGSGAMVSANALPAGRYVVRVTGGNSTNVNYALDVAVTPGDARMCVDDGAEDDDLISEPRLISPASLADGEALSRGIACGSDDDWLRVDVTGPTRIVADLLFDAPADDLDFYLDERQGFTDLSHRLASSNGTTTAEHIEGTVPSAGTVTFLVRRFGGAPAPAYTVQVHTEAISTADGGCVDDLADTALAAGAPGGPLETRNDDTAATAMFLSPDYDVAPARAICPMDADWYAVILNAGDRLTVDVDYTYAAGKDVDVRVFAPSAPDTVAAAGTTSDDDEHVEYTASGNGVHRIQVYGYQGSSNTYELTVSVSR